LFKVTLPDASELQNNKEFDAEGKDTSDVRHSEDTTHTSADTAGTLGSSPDESDVQNPVLASNFTEARD